jgi:16S rRNA (adenine1518-N6/adenine1519-N6)-dimethyltransferase
MDSSLNLSPLNVTQLLRRFQLSPRKGLGQNFLTEPSHLKKIVEAAGVSSEDLVVEIGPGLGSLTRYLAVAARKVVAVELDAALFPVLEFVLGGFGNVTLIQGDALKLAPEKMAGEEPYLLVANIPYYITSALIRHFLDSRNQPKRLVLTMQREVAERICAKPGDMSLLAISVQVYGEPQIVHSIPAGAFYPQPEVDSSVLRVNLNPEPLVPLSQMDNFFRLVKAGFSQKRKTLRNSLSGGLAWKPILAEGLLSSSEVDPRRRAETLSLDEWRILTENYVRMLAENKTTP